MIDGRSDFQSAPHHPVCPSANELEIYRSDDLRIVCNLPPSPAASFCVVAFDPLTDADTLDRSGFADRFFEKLNLPAVHIMCRLNRWYNEADLPQALEAVREVTQRYDRVITYGSSMGGYAAITFATACGADTVVAVSPQFDIDPAAVPFERRWLKYQSAISYRRHVTPTKPAHVYLFYDPFDPDAEHARLIGLNYNTQQICIRNAGHPALHMLAETGGVRATIWGLISGTLDASEIERWIWSRRRLSGQYLVNLAKRMTDRQLRMKSFLAERAVSASPRSAGCLAYRGIVIDSLPSGPKNEAEACFQQALQFAPSDPFVLELCARFHLRHAAVTTALEIASRAVALAPIVTRAQRTLGLAHISAGRLIFGGRLVFGNLGVEWAPSASLNAVYDVICVLAWRYLRGGTTDGSKRVPIPIRWGNAVTIRRRKKRRVR